MSSEPERRPPRAPMGGRLAWWPFVAAFIGVAVVVVVIVVVGSGTTGSDQQGTGLTSSGAVACPRFYEHADTDWVPAKPAGVHPRGKLVPKLHPTHVTICRYRTMRRSTDRSLRLSGQRELKGRLDQVVDTLRRLPGYPRKSVAACANKPFNFLIGMRYAEAIVWVSVPGLTCGTGNGSFKSPHSVWRVAAASYAARTWVSSPK